VGFFQYIGLEAGKAPGEAKGSRRYVPIQCIDRAELIQTAGQAPIQEAIEKRCDQLAEVVFPQMTEQLMMSYCLREVIRNVFEHAQTDTCTVMAQRYSDGTAQIAIIDGGIGIYRSLSSAHTCGSVDDALRLALQPGTSRVVGDQTGQRWDNSGFGLYILSQLGRQLGYFLVVSNGRFLQLGSPGKKSIKGDVPFNGTGIKLTVDLANAAYFPNLLHRIVATGEEQLASSGDKHKKASTSSKSLSQQ
jgi:anti-sigma regulatory factor (Ser/Thr protein kinase)